MFVLALGIATLTLGVGRGQTGAVSSNTGGFTLASCVSDLHPQTGPSQGAPSPALLSMLAVLRRSARPSDALPSNALRGEPARVFVSYIRRARTGFGRTWYLVPTLAAQCAPRKPSYRISLLSVSASGWARGGGPSATQIRQGSVSLSAQSPAPVPGKHYDSDARSLVEVVVPDGVATVTFRYAARAANRYHGPLLPFTVTTAPVNNVVLADIPRNPGSDAIRHATMIWRSASGKILRAIHGTP